MTEGNGEAIFRLPGEGATTSLFGDTHEVKAAGEDTGGVRAVIEADLAPHSGGTPLHVNTLEDENYYVVERMAAVYEKYGLRVVGPPPSNEP